MEELSRITSGKGWKNWVIETLDLETGQSFEAVGRKAIQWGEKKEEGRVLAHQFEQLQAMSPKERGRYVEFLGSIRKLPEGLQEISKRLAELKVADIERKSGHMWDCIGFKDGIYEFRMKEEYRDDEKFWQKTKEIAPAVEPYAEYVSKMLNTERVKRRVMRRDELSELGVFDTMPLRDAYEKFGIALLEMARRESVRDAVMSLIYEDLGYGATGTTMQLPDQRELERRWAILQEKNPMLADLRVLAAMGIATDEAFVWGYVTHNMLLSNDKEFVHDHTVHVASQIRLLASLAAKGIDFEKYKHSIAQGVFSLYKKILSVEHNLKGLDTSFQFSPKELAMLKRSMGAVIDLFSADTVVVDPSTFRRQARAFLQDRESDFYRSSVTDFGEKDIKRLPLLWAKLELATAPLYGYPKLAKTEVVQLFKEDPKLSGVCARDKLWVRSASGQSLEFSYTLVEGTRLVVNDGKHRFEADLENKGRVSQHELKELSELVQRNEKKLSELVKSLPKRLQKGATATQHAPFSVEDHDPDDFALWRWKSIYGEGFGLSVVVENHGRQFFQNYIVYPLLKENVIGFEVSRDTGEELEFITASAYEQLALHLEKSGLDGEKLGSEIEYHSDS